MDTVLFLAAAAAEAAANAAPAQADAPSFAESLSRIAALGIRCVSIAGMLMVALCILVSLFRILRGPTLTDRILASDALSLFVVALVLLLGESLATSVFYDAALMVAILGFVATIAMSRFLLTHKPGRPTPQPPQPPEAPEAPDHVPPQPSQPPQGA